MRNFQMKGRRCAPARLPSLRVTRGLQPVCRPFYLSLGYSDVALAIAGFHVDRRGRDRAQGQQIMIVALGKLHPASNCAGTFFPVARLVKIIASHSEGPPLPHLVHARPERIRLISCYNPRPRRTHGHNRADKGREGQGCAAVERTECSTRSFRRDVQDRIIQTTPENVSSSPCANLRCSESALGKG